MLKNTASTLDQTSTHSRSDSLRHTPTDNPAHLRRRQNSGDLFFLLVSIVLALVLRVDFQMANDFTIDSDEAIVGLMAKHILEGHEIPTFYYGQEYMGSFEPLIVSAVFAVFGISETTLKAVPIGFSIIFLVLVYAIGNELGGRYVARVAAFLAAISPSTLLIWSAKARGGFIEIMCIGSLAFLLTIYWLKKERVSYGLTLAIGGILGFGWWVNNQVIYFMLPIGFAFLARSLHEPGLSIVA
ncbi:MAG: glycosyltransferase family 39 protein [Bdellovibrionales bacterium]|nr:glycosyltransferase family 39 protein [Bdellovibrionales bacterium]